MRIIAGQYRSRVLETPEDDSVTRPIPDRIKESLFGLLRGHCQGATVFDGFAGTGAIGLEALSRGATRVVFVERNPGIAAILRRNIESLGAIDRCEIVVGDALGPGALARCPRPLTLGFLDPPYALVREPVGLSRARDQLARMAELLTPDGYVILRTPWPLEHEETPQAETAPEPKRRKPRRDQARGWQQPERYLERPRGRAAEADDPDDEADEPETPAAPRTASRPASLAIPGTVGPESHLYKTQAIHLYARPRADTAPT